MNTDKLHLVQLRHPGLGRRVARVEEPGLILLKDFRSVYELALHAIEVSKPLIAVIPVILSGERINYDDVYEGRSDWKLLPSFDHPESPFFLYRFRNWFDT